MATARYLFDDHPDAQQLVMMPPNEFLRLTLAPGYESMIRDQNISPLAERMEADREIDPAYLEVDIDTHFVVAHEGRHRAAAAERLGIEKIPVILFYGRGGHVLNFGRLGLERPTYPEFDLRPEWLGKRVR